MKSFIATIVALTVLLTPFSASAQFIPINQAKQLGSMNQQQDLDDVLNQISLKGNAAQKQIAALFGNSKLNQTTAKNKAEVITVKLKEQLNTILTSYAKKAPSGTSLREAFKASQDTLNASRRMAEEGIDQLQIAKQENPGQLTGKYLDYQEQIKTTAEKALSTADERLADRGSRETLKKDLQQLVKDTEKQIEIVTTSYLATNTDLLASAIQRVKKGVLEDFSAAMTNRFKTAESRSNDKAQDLTADEQEIIVGLKAEMDGLVDRVIQTSDQLTQSISGQQLPTSTNVVGVNPQLEAKFSTQKKIQEIKQGALERIDKIEKKFKARTDVSALAKEVLSREAQRSREKLRSTIEEYRNYFLAGDPTKKEYNDAKNDAQEEARGCTSILCDIGNIAGQVGSGLISTATRGAVNIPGQSLSRIIGVDQPDPYAKSRYANPYTNYSSLPNINGRYYAPGAYGNVSMPYGNNGCLSDAGNSFIGKAYAQEVPGEQSAANTTLTYPASTTTTTTQKTNTPNIWAQAGFGLANSLFGRLVGGNGSYGVPNPCVRYGVPNNIYSSPFGGLPIGQTLGYGNNNLGLNVNSSGYVGQLYQGFQIMANRDSSYNSILPYFADNQLTFNEMSQISEFLKGKGFFNIQSTDDYWKQPIVNLFGNMCTQIFTDSSMQSFCKGILIPSTQRSTPGFNPGLSGQVQQNPAISTNNNAIDPQTLEITALKQDVLYMSFVNQEANKLTKCAAGSPHQIEVIAIETRTSNAEAKLQGYGTRQAEVQSILLQLKPSIAKYHSDCQTPQVTAGPTQTQAQSDLASVTSINTILRTAAANPDCVLGRKYVLSITQILTTVNNNAARSFESNPTDPIISQLMIQLKQAGDSIKLFNQKCPTATAAGTSSTIIPVVPSSGLNDPKQSLNFGIVSPFTKSGTGIDISGPAGYVFTVIDTTNGYIQVDKFNNVTMSRAIVPQQKTHYDLPSGSYKIFFTRNGVNDINNVGQKFTIDTFAGVNKVCLTIPGTVAACE